MFEEEKGLNNIEEEDKEDKAFKTTTEGNLKFEEIEENVNLDLSYLEDT